VLAGVFDETVRIESESASRLAQSGEQGFNAKLAVLAFESPEVKSEKPAGKRKKAKTATA
jgi:hypothetical protein